MPSQLFSEPPPKMEIPTYDAWEEIDPQPVEETHKKKDSSPIIPPINQEQIREEPKHVEPTNQKSQKSQKSQKDSAPKTKSRFAFAQSADVEEEEEPVSLFLFNLHKKKKKKGVGIRFFFSLIFIILFRPQMSKI